MAFLALPALLPPLMVVAAPALIAQQIIYGTLTSLVLARLWPQPYASALST